MKIVAQKREGNTAILEIEEEYQAFVRAYDQALVAAGKEIKLPGFRPGKAPKELIERSVNKDVVEGRAAQMLISELYPSVLDEAKLEPVDFPNVEIVQQKKNKPFIFKIIVDVYPEVKLGKYKGLSVEKKKVEVTETDVDRILGSIQNRFAKKDKNGKPELMPLNDDFAKKVSHFGTLAELRAELEQALTRDRQAEADADMRNQLVARAVAETKMDIPPAMIEREIDVMIDEMRVSLARTGLSFDDYLKGIKKDEKTMREDFRKSADLRVRGKVILRAVAEAEKMKINEEDMEAELKNLAGSSGEKLEEIRQRLKQEGRRYIEEYLLRQKALDFLAEKAKIKEVKAEKQEEAKQ
ncbi:MAG: hypothetical protein JW782_04640 [Candidatus Saganbacteria bacterium]|nr:hypothetical protein [Candidatus Saganbacteria bacterium]